MGDYLGIAAHNGWVYPCWTDTRSGYMTYVSPFQTINIIAPTNLQATIDQETGECSLTWNHEGGNGFEHFNIYRNDVFITSTNDEFFSDLLTEYGYYTYKVTATYSGDNESLPSIDEVQYGTASIVIDPDTYISNLYVGDSSIQYMAVKNTGELDLEFSMSPHFDKTNTATYEPASGGGDEYIRNVTISNLNYTSGEDHYLNYSSQYIRIQSDKSYPIIVEAGNSYNGDQCAVWVDWNNNGGFEEAVTILLPDDRSTFFTGNIEVPKGSAHGISRMRVRLVGPGETLMPTGDSKYGEVEDYNILIEDWLSINPDEGIVAPGDSLMVEIKFNSEGLGVGTYEDNFRFVTNDINNVLVTLYFTMNISDMQVTASIEPESICIGESSQLTAMPTGGSGSFTFAWISNPAGFESSEQNAMITPDVNTNYFLAASDGVITTYDTVSVIVNALPEVNLGDDQVLCGIGEFPLDAGNTGAEYMWSTGETLQTIDATGTGNTSFWVKVTNTTGCLSSDTVAINFASIPSVNLGSDTVICHNESIELDADNVGSAYLWSTGETTQKIMVNAEDYEFGIKDFLCEVTNIDGCNNTGEVTVEIKDCTGIDEFGTSIGIDIFPNPNNGIFNLEFNTAENKNLNIKVVSITGVLVYHKENILVNGSATEQINLNEFAEGIYSVFVSSEEHTINKKLILRK